MGCGGSRLGGRLQPLFLLHARRPPPKLLLNERDDEDEISCSISQKYGTPLSEEENVVFGRTLEEKHGNPKLEDFEKNQGSKDESEFEDALADAYEDEDENENENEDKDKDKDRARMIGHQDEGAFPGSPTFRHFFKDVGDNDLGKIYAISSDDDDTVSSKENYNDQNKKVKRGRKRKSFKKVLSKGGQAAVKKLLNVKSCYTQSSSTLNHDHQRHPLVGKTAA